MRIRRNLRIPTATYLKIVKIATRAGLDVKEYVSALIRSTASDRFRKIPSKPMKKGPQRMINFYVDPDAYERFLDRCQVQGLRPQAGAAIAHLVSKAA